MAQTRNTPTTMRARDAHGRFAATLPANVSQNGKVARPTEQDLSVRAVEGSTQSILFPSILSRGNPDAMLLNIAPKRSKSGAHQLLYLVTRNYFDFLDEMASREPISSALKKTVSWTLNRPNGFRWENEEDAEHPRADEILSTVDECLTKAPSRFGWEGLRRNTVRGIFRHGFAVHRVDWMVSDGLWVPKGYYHEHPGRFIFSVDGDLWLYNRQEPFEAPPFRFLVAGSPGMYANPFGEPIIYDLRYDYAIRQAGLTSWVRFCDRYGFPFIIGTAPEGTVGGDEYNKHATEFESAMKTATHDVALFVPHDTKIEALVRSGGQKESPHQKIVEYEDRTMTKNLLGAILQVMEAEHGSRAQATEHTKSQDTEMRPWSAQVCEAIQELVNNFVLLNYGPEAPVPVCFIDPENATDFAVTRENFKAAMEAQLPVLKTEGYDSLGLSMPTPEQIEAGETIEAQPEPTPVAEAPPVPGEEEEGKAEAAELRATAPAIVFKALTANRSKTAARFRKRRDKVTKFLAEQYGPRMQDSIAAAVEQLKEVLPPHDGIPLPPDATELSMFRAPRTVEDLDLAIAGMHLLQWSAMWTQVRPNEGTRKFIDPIVLAEPLPEFVRDAAEWMNGRGVMTMNEMNNLAAMLSAFDPTFNGELFEQIIRKDVLVIARSMSQVETAIWRDMLTASINRGESAVEFLERMDRDIASGAIGSQQDAYARNVFRTEQANAWGAARDKLQAEPAIVAATVGYELVNPGDSASRETHRPFGGGINVKAGGAADIASRPGPPWDYQCRCDRFPIFADEPDGKDFEEDPEALGLVKSLERFGTRFSDSMVKHSKYRLENMTPPPASEGLTE